MTNASFKTNPISLYDLLKDCHRGKVQLPDFQRSWVWDEDRIKSLIASISRAFPVGALMALETGGGVNFKPRPVEGAPPEATIVVPEILLLDGQQRITSMYQVTLRGQVVQTVTPKNKRVRRWFYIDIRKALDPMVDREESIVGVPEDRVIRKDFAREVVLDLSTIEHEYEALMFPVTKTFDWFDWYLGLVLYWQSKGDVDSSNLISSFKELVLEVFKTYQVPVITLDKGTTKEAVCVVFEKVNTGGKPLDAFELVTAMYAAEGHELRKDWYGDEKTKLTGRHTKLKEFGRLPSSQEGILADVSNTDFLQAISLFSTREARRLAEAQGRSGKDLPAVSSNRQALLSLPLGAYKRFQSQVEDGFILAAKFLFQLRIYRTFDLPYQSQIVPLAAILADLGNAWQHTANREKLIRWYWSGVFGELYGSSVDTRNARDFIEVPEWLRGGLEPMTVQEAQFHPDRLKTMRMRLSAAYKGVNALLMLKGCRDFRSGQIFDHTVFFDEATDIHHIFPQDWCKKQGIPKDIYDSIINKTPLSARTNRIIGGVAPSEYLATLERGDNESAPIDGAKLDSYLKTHLTDPELVRADRFEDFMKDRQKRLLSIIEEAMGKGMVLSSVMDDPETEDRDEDELESGRILEES